MTVSQKTIQNIAVRGQALYERAIRQDVEPQHTGKFLVLDVDTGDYEIDTNEVAAFDRAIARNPSGSRYLVRIGHAAAHRLGGHMSVKHP